MLIHTTPADGTACVRTTANRSILGGINVELLVRLPLVGGVLLSGRVPVDHWPRGYGRWEAGATVMPGVGSRPPDVVVRLGFRRTADVPIVWTTVRAPRPPRMPPAPAPLTQNDVERVWEALGGDGACPGAVDFVALAERVGERLAPDRGTARCTGVTAKWCPRCGDCTCPPLREGGDPCEVTLDDPRCPLHSPKSSHGENAL